MLVLHKKHFFKVGSFLKIHVGIIDKFFNNSTQYKQRYNKNKLHFKKYKFKAKEVQLQEN